LKELVDGATGTSRSAQQISLSTEQQRTASNQIVQAMRELTQGSRDSAQALEELKIATASLEERSCRLADLVERFASPTD
jgi:methyl-accepting chemotaxis protein